MQATATVQVLVARGRGLVDTSSATRSVPCDTRVRVGLANPVTPERTFPAVVGPAAKGLSSNPNWGLVESGTMLLTPVDM